MLFNKGAKSALNIGLGVGFAASALQGRGVQVDVIELHPEVYNAAVQHFGFNPGSGRAYTEDALQVVPRLLTDPERGPGHYGLVIHDVFAGGGVPAALFSRSLLGQLRTLVHPTEGVLAVNYVGLGPSAKSEAPAHSCLAYLASELQAVFGHVRAFVDSQGGDEETLRNYVLFASASPLSPAKPSQEDIGQDPTRARYLFHLFDYEVVLPPLICSCGNCTRSETHTLEAGSSVGMSGDVAEADDGGGMEAQGGDGNTARHGGHTTGAGGSARLASEAAAGKVAVEQVQGVEGVAACFGKEAQLAVARAHWQAMSLTYPPAYWVRAY